MLVHLDLPAEAAAVWKSPTKTLWDKNSLVEPGSDYQGANCEPS